MDSRPHRNDGDCMSHFVFIYYTVSQPPIFEYAVIERAMMSDTITVKCPTCQKPVEWKETSEYRPFCSSRCKLIDLGEWAQEKYTVTAEEDDILSDLLKQ